MEKISIKLKLPENLYNVFKEIKAKSNINPSIDQRVRLDDEHIEKIYNLAEKVISLHNYKYIK